MSVPLTLPAKPPGHPALDYNFLRQEGIRQLERLGGGLWTDFNAHDPGITILEQVCYAITDLAYRINYDIKDILLFSKDDPACSLYSPAQVLAIHPVTLTDLRKLAIDVPGVKNAWFEPVEEMQPGVVYDTSEDLLRLEPGVNSSRPAHHEPVPVRGLYRVLLETDPNLPEDNLDHAAEVDRRLKACRPLCQDFLYPTILGGQRISIDAEIEVGAVDDPEELLAEIYTALANFISPGVRFYTLSEMLERGKAMDEIMNGPALRHGFIDDAELERLERKEGLRTSDLLREILKVEGAVAVNAIQILGGARPEAWYMKLDPTQAPYLDIADSFFPVDKKPPIRLVRRGIQVRANPERVYAGVMKRLQQRAAQELLPEQLDVQLPGGRDRGICRYHSIQHQFPATYGIGAMGLPESASQQRKAQAKQLKAYLLFFDQLLANYFAQLGKTRELFSFHGPQPQTYFSQVVEDPSLGLGVIRRGSLEAHAAEVERLADPSRLEETGSGQKTRAPAGRKDRFLNHLLARFAEQFTDYSLLRYAGLQEQDLIEDKSAFLRDYQQIGMSRGCSFDYGQPLSGEESVSGLKKRISLKLGIPAHDRLDLAAMAPDGDGGFHLLEHLLLRPCRADEAQIAGTGWQTSSFLEQPLARDPYSRQVSFIFPKWIGRFAETGFSDLIEKIVREETPAHIRVHLHWLDSAQMLRLESAYRDWLEGMRGAQWWNRWDATPADDQHEAGVALRDARDRMIRILGIGTPYPLRDLKLVCPEMVADRHDAQIQILGGQTDVLYQLCDEDGNPIPEAGKRFEVRPGAKARKDEIFLPTPEIRKDITFTVLAVRCFRVIVRGGEITVDGNKIVVSDHEIPADEREIEVSGRQIIADGRVLDVGGRKILLAGRRITVRGGEIAEEGREIIVDGCESVTRDGEIVVEALETYLNQPVAIKAGIDTTLRVELIPLAGQVVAENQITVDYSDLIQVMVLGTQEGITYQLVVGAKDDFTAISKEQIGNQREISLDSTRPFIEDTQVNIRAHRTTLSQIAALLGTSLAVHVRPNPAVAVEVETPVVDYNASSVLRLVNPQASVEYELFQRRLVPAEYLQDGTQGSLTVRTEEGRTISITVPEKITDWTNLLGFEPVGTFQENQGISSIDTGKLREDTLFIVRATKKENREALQLDRAAVVLVRPDPGPVVEALNTEVERDTAGMVTVSGTQKGVAYQLLLENEPVNPPGYHVTDRGVERARLEVDLIVEGQGDSTLLLPTGLLSTSSTFRVQASKILTGVSLLLPDTAAISVQPQKVNRRGKS